MDDIGFIAENKEKYTSFNIKISVMLAWISNKKLRKNIKHTFINSFRFMVQV